MLVFDAARLLRLLSKMTARNLKPTFRNEWIKKEKSEREGKDGVIRNNLGKEKKKDWNKIFKDVRKRPLC